MYYKNSVSHSTSDQIEIKLEISFKKYANPNIWKLNSTLLYSSIIKLEIIKKLENISTKLK